MRIFITIKSEFTKIIKPHLKNEAISQQSFSLMTNQHIIPRGQIVSPEGISHMK